MNGGEYLHLLKGSDRIPHVLPCIRIHTSGGLVKENNSWFANKGDTNGQLSLCSSTQILGKLVSIFLKLQGLDQCIDVGFSVCQTSQPCVEVKMFFNSEQVK